MTHDLEHALVAMNAAWSGKRIYGREHPLIEQHAEAAAQACQRAVRIDGHATALFLPDRVTIADRVIDAGPVLLAGLFRPMGDTCPDCLRVTPGATSSAVRQFIRAVADTTEHRPGFVVGPFSLRWVSADAGSPAGRAGVLEPAELSHSLRDAWAAAATGVTAAEPLEELAHGIASAVAADSATLLPLARLKQHDEYTFVHAINVGLMSSALCEAVGLSPERTRHITLGAMLHDVGKRAMPPGIINKKGKLTDAERAVMNAHPAAGARILAGSLDLPPVVLTIAYEHHMNLDGTGYPHRPPERRISLPSQIVHIADVYDALRTHRPYRQALPTEKALEIMSEEAGRCYDRELFQVFAADVVRRFAAREQTETPADLKRHVA